MMDVCSTTSLASAIKLRNISDVQYARLRIFVEFATLTEVQSQYLTYPITTFRYFKNEKCNFVEV